MFFGCVWIKRRDEGEPFNGRGEGRSRNLRGLKPTYIARLVSPLKGGTHKSAVNAQLELSVSLTESVVRSR